MAVSIHTPAWGTTHLEQELARIQKQFQSTRLREARRGVVGVFLVMDQFQSTRLREARQVVNQGCT